MKDSLAVYWAGDRGFYSTVRWYDGQVRDAIAKATGWTVLDPFEHVAEAAARQPSAPFQGPNGIVRKTCLELIDRSDVLVAYTGNYDTGTAQEMEYARGKGKPIVAWSDAALVRGESAIGGRAVEVGPDEVSKLPSLVNPMNGMTTLYDRYVEDSRMQGPGLNPSQLAAMLVRAIDAVKAKPPLRR